MTVAGRLRVAVVVAAVGLVAATGWRTARLVEARPGDEVRVVPLDVERIGGGGILVEPSGERWTARSLRTGRTVALVPGADVRLGRVRLELDRNDGLRRTEVLRRPWTVFAHPTDGHRRIDFGADPLGAGDGVRDRVVLPRSERGPGWFHLAPATSERFTPTDAGVAVLVVERGGLRVDGVVVGDGDRIAVADRFVVADDEASVAVEVAWEAAARAVPVTQGGRIVGYREVAGTDFVVTALDVAPEGAGATRLAVADRRGAPVGRVRLSAGRATLLHGRADRVSPLRGRVLPVVAPNEELEAAVDEGLSSGWVDVGPDRTSVVIPVGDDATPREDLGWALSSAVVDLLDRYDRARAPVALRLGPGADAAGATDAVGAALRYDAELDAWTPSSQPRAGEPSLLTVPRAPDAGDSITVAAAFPIAWRPVAAAAASPGTAGPDPAGPDPGPWVAVPPPPPGRWAEWTLDAGDAEAVQIRLDAVVAPFEADAPARVAVAVAGGPDGTHLLPGEVRTGTRAFGSWSTAGDRSTRAAKRLWRGVPGDRWTAAGEVTAPAEGADRLYLRVPLTARRGGWTALDLEVPGRVLNAAWNDAPLDPPAFALAPRGGRGRLSVKTRPGANLLALELELPPDAPAEQAGGVRFELDAATGRPARLAPRVADRRARAPVADRVAAAPDALEDRDGDDAPWLDVERSDLAALPPGARWRVAPSVGRAAVAELLLADDRALHVVTDGAGSMTVESPVGGTLWSADARPTVVVPHVPTEWPPGARLVLEGSTLRLRRPLEREAAALDARPAWLTRWDPDADGPVTLDDDLQADVEAALDATLEAVAADTGGGSDGDTLALRGAVLVMDARTGDVLACASRDRPDADPRTVVREPCWEDAGVHPGSTFKLATAAAALQSEDPTVRAMLDGALPDGLTRDGPRNSLRGARLPALPLTRDPLSLRSRLRNWGGRWAPTDVDLDVALRDSLNTWFGYVGLLLHRPLREGWVRSAVAEASARDAAWPVAAVARAAGFNGRFDLGGGYAGTGGHVPAGAPDDDAPIAARSIGQDGVTATPAGIAALVAAAVEGGVAPRPRLSRDRPAAQVVLLDAASASRLRAGLTMVVSRGTAAAAFADNPRRDRVAGKTGSAQRIDGRGVERTDAWFAAAVRPPEGVDEASVVVVVCLPGAGLGGRHAAGLGDDVSRAIAAFRGWE